MRFSLWGAVDRPFAEVLAGALEAERRGWHAVYFADHFMPNGADATPLRGNVYEAMVTLSALAARTTSIRLGTLVASATYRHPAVAAKMFSTLDELSGGRVIVGLGAGWQENEHASYGIRLGSINERVSRFEEYVEIVASMLASESTTFQGEFYEVTGAPCDPRPVQSPPPILLGVRGEKRTMALAARYAGTWNAWTTPDDLRHLNSVLDRHCERLGRDPQRVTRSTQAMVTISTDEEFLKSRRAAGGGGIVGTPPEVLEALAAYRDAGCQEFIVPTFGVRGADRLVEIISLLDEGVAQHLR